MSLILMGLMGVALLFWATLIILGTAMFYMGFKAARGVAAKIVIILIYLAFIGLALV